MIDHIEIQGYKSIKKLALELRPINVLIGSNGAGKSNFISFFNLLRAIFGKQLQRFVLEEGKADSLLYFGRKTTEHLYGKLLFSEGNGHQSAYWFDLRASKQEGLFIDQEASAQNIQKGDQQKDYTITGPYEESHITKHQAFEHQYLSDIAIFHFHDTSSTSYLRRGCDVEDNQYFKSDGRNLPAFLYRLKAEQPIIYKRILKTIQSVAPYIYDFILTPSMTPGKQGEIELRWVDKNDLNSNFSAYQLSDGTLRFIALATVLMQPIPPSVIVIDEPELGLHPMAITKLAGMIQAVSQTAQVIISTQSVNLVDCFEPDDIVTVDRDSHNSESIFQRLEEKELDLWLQEHSLGDLWRRNIIHSAQPFTK
ncbi:AAA family ATPase [Algivirga pacifica]|uniref:AAA family ATPase n=1 Tax=Algivirga pacifica TaxID=1162670 RepID=A0ABP9DNC8_9BACT